MMPLPRASDETELLPRERKPGSVELWRRYHATGPGDASEEELVKKYLPLVKTVVGRLAMNLPPQIEAEELQSAGMIGLLNAVRNFNPQSGCPFEAYARLRIRGAVLDTLRRMDWAPRSVQVRARQVQKAMAQLEQREGRVPNDDEMAAALQISVDDYHQWLEEIRPATLVCLDAVHREEDEEEGTHHEIVSDPTQEDAAGAASRAELARLIAERIQQLPELHRKVIALYYFEDLRMREIAEAAGLSESRICQVHTQAILAIKSYLETREALPRKC
jgi:RNA polymerase sigma factor for flagellar operon FliA